MERCGSCDGIAPTLAECGGDACELRVGPCCMTCDGLCLPCGDEFAAAAQHKEREDREERTRLILILSGSTIGGLRMPLVGQAVRP